MSVWHLSKYFWRMRTKYKTHSTIATDSHECLFNIFFIFMFVLSAFLFHLYYSHIHIICMFHMSSHLTGVLSLCVCPWFWMPEVNKKESKHRCCHMFYVCQFTQIQNTNSSIKMNKSAKMDLNSKWGDFLYFFKFFWREEQSKKSMNKGEREQREGAWRERCVLLCL